MLTQVLTPVPKYKLNFCISYTSMSIRLPHLCQEYHSHCVTTANDRVGWEGWRWLIYVGVWEEGEGVGITLFLLFVLLLCCCWLLFHDWCMMVVVFVSLFLFAFFVSGPFNYMLLVQRNCCVCSVKLFQKSSF